MRWQAKPSTSGGPHHLYATHLDSHINLTLYQLAASGSPPHQQRLPYAALHHSSPSSAPLCWPPSCLKHPYHTNLPTDLDNSTGPTQRFHQAFPFRTTAAPPHCPFCDAADSPSHTFWLCGRACYLWTTTLRIWFDHATPPNTDDLQTSLLHGTQPPAAP
ncbi:hypothetical protein H257_14837 [Aphanomyces astaci]|uniref:Uncharacterized protein n=1 Tax=Aphanomyces astaci TaxID=112090 RepID=W4FPQ2_APHAT|nr:hypothetical protein H257_14837 [Aphanomyces astaci]ETV69467.1 hypothetical protein H257_14837 [Aphanomyces astaci]|eukprot:XP_009841040.1 hypothetical protein H257_14837 [Aphanomyces astaci]